MTKSARIMWSSSLFVAAACLCGCQKATSASETIDVDDFVDAAITPGTATAAVSTDGRTYRIVRGNNQPDEILTFAYKTTFQVQVTINSNATDDDMDLEFPVEITSLNAKVEQASGGIVTAPTGGEVEHYDSVVSGTSGKTFSGPNTSVTFNYDVWYTLPSGGKEAMITISVAFKDDDSRTFTKTVKVLVNP